MPIPFTRYLQVIGAWIEFPMAGLWRMYGSLVLRRPQVSIRKGEQEIFFDKLAVRVEALFSQSYVEHRRARTVLYEIRSSCSRSLFS